MDSGRKDPNWAVVQSRQGWPQSWFPDLVHCPPWLPDKVCRACRHLCPSEQLGSCRVWRHKRVPFVSFCPNQWPESLPSRAAGILASDQRNTGLPLKGGPSCCERIHRCTWVTLTLTPHTPGQGGPAHISGGHANLAPDLAFLLGCEPRSPSPLPLNPWHDPVQLTHGIHLLVRPPTEAILLKDL